MATKLSALALHAIATQQDLAVLTIEADAHADQLEREENEMIAHFEAQDAKKEASWERYKGF